MIQDFITSHISKAKYELIEGDRRFYAEIPSLRGVWAVGKNVEECRENLISTLEGWFIFRLRNNLPVPHFKIPRKINFSKVHA